MSNHLKEVESAELALEALRNVVWAQPLINRINRDGGIIEKNKPLLFELRYAHALHDANVIPEYEATGVGESTIDFRVKNKFEWNIELVSIGISDAVKKATQTDGVFTQILLKTDNIDRRCSEEGEVLKVQEKILSKVVRSRKEIEPIKFFDPAESSNIINVILVDMRGFLGISAADNGDYIGITLGNSFVPGEFRRYWFNPSTQRNELIRGLYEEGNPLNGVVILRKRIHFIGFICEKNYTTNELKKAVFVHNPHLISEQRAKEICNYYPLGSAI